jgi:AcrR family transcriptional regulator
MPRHPDPDLEDRILHAADVLWRRGGEKSLTMRAVARAAKTNTPAVYRRFKDRRDLVKALLLRIAVRTREHFQQGETIEDMAEAYVEYALRLPNDYLLFYSHVRELSPPKGAGKARPIRESRPNFALLEKLLAKHLGGQPEEHTQLALEVWAALHGTTMLLLQKSIPEGHEEELREACRAAVRTLLNAASQASRPN